MRLRLLYWVPTVQVVLVMASGGLVDALRMHSGLAVFHHLGYPDYFSTLLGVAQVLGVVALLAPVPRTLREWAYAGFTFDVACAIVSILAVGDAASHVAIPLYALAMLQLSYFAWRRRERTTARSTMSERAPQPA
jgi:DoxX-like protein